MSPGAAVGSCAQKLRTLAGTAAKGAEQPVARHILSSFAEGGGAGAGPAGADSCVLQSSMACDSGSPGSLRPRGAQQRGPHSQNGARARSD
eukprot:COSAG01_NODE_8140_length_2902_cov_56.215889_1_plen_90_part_10